MAGTDYAAILADMEAKKNALESAIASLRAALASGALGASGSEISGPMDSVSSSAPTSGGVPVSLPRGAFLGKTVTDAIKTYLSAVRRKQTNREIARALKDGGLESSGKFDAYVTSGLFRLKKEGTVLRFNDGWGLAEWYPEGFRMRVSGKAVSNKRRKNSKRGATAKSAKSSGKPTVTPPIPGGGLEHRIEALVRSMPNKIFSSAEITHTLGAGIVGVTLALGRMAKKRKIEKTEGGFRMFSGNVQEMPKAV